MWQFAEDSPLRQGKSLPLLKSDLDSGTVELVSYHHRYTRKRLVYVGFKSEASHFRVLR
jgi:hypothetical protein